MKKKTAAAVLAVSVLAGGGAALTTPAFAADSSTSSSTSATDRAAARLSSIKDALKGLVTNGTITQAQADKVATTLSQSPLAFGRGGHGPGGRVSPEATAAAIGITVDQLRAGLDSGKTLTQLAAAKGISRATLVSRLVAAAKTELAADLKAGRLTQAQYDSAVSTLAARVGERVDRVGHGPGDHDGPPPAAPAPATSSTPSA